MGSSERTEEQLRLSLNFLYVSESDIDTVERSKSLDKIQNFSLSMNNGIGGSIIPASHKIEDIICLFCKEHECRFGSQDEDKIEEYNSFDDIEYIIRILGEKSLQEMETIYGSIENILYVLEAVNREIFDVLEGLRIDYIDCQIELNRMMVHIGNMHSLCEELIEMGCSPEAVKLLNCIDLRKKEIIERSRMFVKISSMYNIAIKMWASSDVIYRKYASFILNRSSS